MDSKNTERTQKVAKVDKEKVTQPKRGKVIKNKTFKRRTDKREVKGNG